MSTNNDELLYDEDDSVKFIQNYLPQELKGKFSNDDINYIVDLIYDFYESNGMLDDDGDDEIEIDEEEVVNYVIKNAQKDGVGKFEPEEITFIVQGEHESCAISGITALSETARLSIQEPSRTR